MQLFDQHIDRFEVVGGADDITVESIFGGTVDADKHDYSADYDSAEEPTGGAPQTEEKEDQEEEEAPTMVSSMSISFEADGDGEELTDNIEVVEEPHKKIIDDLNLNLDSPKGSSGGDLSAFDISKLISEYK